jgi:multicomponent Na+:H+ antiporter subunit B
MFTGIYSFLGASWMLILDAPDVAFTEAAVGAGISTVLMLGTLSLTGKEEKPTTGSPLMPLLVVTVTGAALIYGTLDMPHFGDPAAPVHQHPNPGFVERVTHDMHGLPNIVTGVLASYRAYDTLGETAVIFTAGIAVLLILRPSTRDDDAVMEEVERSNTLDVATNSAKSKKKLGKPNKRIGGKRKRGGKRK